MANRLQFRRGTAATATSANPVLADGELGYETDTLQFKVGDGVSNWNDLDYGGIIGPQGPQGEIGDNYWRGSNRFISTADPDDVLDGVDGDFWFKYV